MKGGTRVLLAITVLVVVLVGVAVWSEMKPKTAPVPAPKAGVQQAEDPNQPQAKKPKTSHSSRPMFGSGTLGG